MMTLLLLLMMMMMMTMMMIMMITVTIKTSREITKHAILPTLHDLGSFSGENFLLESP